MQSNAIVLYVSKKKSQDIIIFNDYYGKVQVINHAYVPHLFTGAVIQCNLVLHGSKKYLVSSSLNMTEFPSSYSELIFTHSLLSFINHTHLYENACIKSFEVLQTSLSLSKKTMSIAQKIKIIAKLCLFSDIASEEFFIAKNITDYLLYTSTSDMLRETANNIDYTMLIQWIWSCLLTHPHKDKLHVVFQQMRSFKEHFSL